MIYDIETLLKPGTKFPFECEHNRIKRYIDYYNALHGDYHLIESFRYQFDRCKEEVDHWNQMEYNILPINYNKKIVYTTKDLVFNQCPIIETNLTYDKDDLIEILKEVTVDRQVFGVGVTYTFIEDNEIKTQTINPINWFPEVDKFNINKINKHCIIVEIDDILYVSIHIDKKSIARKYHIKNGTIGALISEEEIITGLTDNAIEIIKNIDSSSIYGTSDFEDYNNIIAQLIVGKTQINRVIDKHVDPITSVPESAIEEDEYGNAVLRTKKALIMAPGDELPQRITWDGKLEAAFNNQAQWSNELANISSLGKMFLGTADDKLISGLSGEALRRMNLPAITKVNNLRHGLTKLINELLEKYAELNLENYNEAEITWQELFADSDSEKIDYITKRIDTGTISIKNAIIYLDGIDQDEAQKEAEDIDNESNDGADVID